jgi:hypothetical protein
MNDTLVRDSLKIAHESFAESQKTSNINELLIWIAIIEFVIIILLLIRRKSKIKDTPKTRFKKESLNGEIDFHNIIDSSFNSIQLFDELKVKCHPDRFPTDKEKNEIADSLFQEISKNKTNIKRLLELKEEAIQKLNINF